MMLDSLRNGPTMSQTSPQNSSHSVKRASYHAKRGFDIIAASALLSLSLPLMILTAAAIASNA
jgi:lipopolysaccharide/colanic/teichoic acid biosynthesis glycosyltransferase